MSAPNRNALWAGALVDELARSGVRHVVVSPGSRSTPLVLAAAADARLTRWVQLDERSAGFFALGLGRATGRPAAVITTSGTAAANLLPAVVEASRSGVPLLVLTADRPHRLRDSDANQTIDQVRLYGSFTRAFHDVAPPTVEARALRYVRTLACRA
ncbi:MAG: 2-succinyl-5-enolpyruvyl-6-hydroxy-3-cyclohexene-1-carboxylate synthase, partial [Gemmatimonadetes bacterium]